MNRLKLELGQRATPHSPSETVLWHNLVQDYRQRLCTQAGGTLCMTLLITESDPAHFLAATIAAIEAYCPVILGNPQWSESDWHQLIAMNIVNAVWGENPYQLSAPESTTTPLAPGAILIATGGSSGQLRFVHHTWQTLSAAVEGLQRSGLLANTVRANTVQADTVPANAVRFDPLWSAIGQEKPTDHPIHSVCTLPLYHVSGFMQFVRSLLTGGNLIVMPFRSLLSGFQSGFQSVDDRVNLPDPRFPAPNTLSLVPTQLYRLLHIPSQEQHRAAIDWLRQFQIIFVGGAALNPDLSDRARSEQLPLAPTYGMTETAGMVATLSPADFLSGKTSVGRSLPHVKIQVRATNNEISHSPTMGTADPLDDRLTIQGKSLALGYYPPAQSSGFVLNQFVTNDRGFVDSEGYLYLHGRIDRIIITGGENVYPDAIEAIVFNTRLVKDVAIIGIPDADWGQKVVALVVAKEYILEKNNAEHSANNLFDQNNLSTTFIESLKTIVNPLLTPPQRPKEWIVVDEIPRNDRGKLTWKTIAIQTPNHE